MVNGWLIRISSLIKKKPKWTLHCHSLSWRITISQLSWQYTLPSAATGKWSTQSVSIKCTLFTLATHVIEDANDPSVLLNLYVDAITAICMSSGLNIHKCLLQAVINQALW